MSAQTISTVATTLLHHNTILPAHDKNTNRTLDIRAFVSFRFVVFFFRCLWGFSTIASFTMRIRIYWTSDSASNRMRHAWQLSRAAQLQNALFRLRTSRYWLQPESWVADIEATTFSRNSPGNERTEHSKTKDAIEMNQTDWLGWLIMR